jgi:hypothetical protein
MRPPIVAGPMFLNVSPANGSAGAAGAAAAAGRCGAWPCAVAPNAATSSPNKPRVLKRMSSLLKAKENVAGI